MKRDDLKAEIWNAAPFHKRVVGLRKFNELVDAAIGTAPVYQLWTSSSVLPESDQGAAIRFWWTEEFKKKHAVTFGPLGWIIVGSIVNFIIVKLLEWATRSHAHAVMLAGWNAESRRNG
jgi:hypothetical protein